LCGHETAAALGAWAGHVTGKYLKKQAAGDPLFETLRDRAEFKALVQQ
jgi:hypothetical protein